MEFQKHGLNIGRRQFLGALGCATLAGTSQMSRLRAQGVPDGCPAGSVPTLLPDGSFSCTDSALLPDPKASGIEHIVVVTMENRSFDHLLGWVPNADGKQAGIPYNDSTGVTHYTHELATDFEGCGHPDPDHSYNNSRVAYDNGKMDGFRRAGNNDDFSIGYYKEGDLPFYTALVQNYTVCDAYFASILGPTFPNRMFLWAAQTDRLGDTIQLSSLTTIFDRLSQKNISHRYYFNNVPYLAFWGVKYLFSTGLFSEFMSHAAAGTLPAVSFVDPVYTVLDDGTGNDDHPHADVRNGDAFLAKIYNALSSNKTAWQKTVLIITFDEWGGFFDHVAPPRVVAPNKVDPDLQNGNALLGFRIPPIIVSPFTQVAGGAVNHTVFDHTSILKLIEWRWGLTPLTARDASNMIGNLANAMKFPAPSSSAPALQIPPTVFATPCFGGGIFSASTQPITAGATKGAGGNAQTGLTEWGQFAQTDTVRQWMQHPNFRQSVE